MTAAWATAEIAVFQSGRCDVTRSCCLWLRSQFHSLILFAFRPLPSEPCAAQRCQKIAYITHSRQNLLSLFPFRTCSRTTMTLLRSSLCTMQWIVQRESPVCIRLSQTVLMLSGAVASAPLPVYLCHISALMCCSLCFSPEYWGPVLP